MSAITARSTARSDTSTRHTALTITTEKRGS